MRASRPRALESVAPSLEQKANISQKSTEEDPRGWQISHPRGSSLECEVVWGEEMEGGQAKGLVEAQMPCS